MNEGISYVGLDVHKVFIQVAMVAPGGEVQEWRTPNAPTKVLAMIRKIRSHAAGAVELCYEAGPTGYALSRTLNAEPGFHCQVIAPSLIPRKPGERVKTDRRDAKKLMKLLRCDELTEVRPPSPTDEARREVCRARQAAKEDEKRAKHRLSKFLLRHGRAFTEGKVAWTDKHLTWLERQRFENRFLEMAFNDLRRALEQSRDRVRELDQLLEEVAQDEAIKEPVAILRCFKGIDLVTAISVVCELHSFERFTSPRGLMAFLGLTPSEYSSGGKANRGGITKAGNTRVRRLLVEAAWNYTRSPQIGLRLRTRREGQPGWAIDIADKAMHRLHRRYWRLVTASKKEPNKAVVAIARELIGFIWSALMTHHANQLEVAA